MKNSLGTFEYGARVKWSTLVAVCFLAMLMLPSLGYAAAVGGGGGSAARTVSAQNFMGTRSSTTIRWNQTAAQQRCCGWRLCGRCRVGGFAQGTNTGNRDMRVRIQGLRNGLAHWETQSTWLAPGRSGRTGIQLGCRGIYRVSPNHDWRVQITNRCLLRATSGTGTLWRSQ